MTVASSPAEIDPAAAFIVDVDGFEGPLDLLLGLARTHKVDLRQVSILQLAEQYLAFITEARRARLELAAEYLVMAAWLAYLKSRLLLPSPPEPEDTPSAEAMAEALAARLRALDAIRAAAARLADRPRLGRDVFARGLSAAAGPAAVPRWSAAGVDLGTLVAAYARVARRQASPPPLAIDPGELASVEAALARLRQLIGGAPGWSSLVRYLPAGTLDGVRQGRLSARSAVAATFTACLELAREGALVLRQVRPFGPIFVHPAPPENELPGEGMATKGAPQ